MESIYKDFCNTKKYNPATCKCIEGTVKQLLETDTTIQKPGMLLGKIQSGKTRTFIGITALAFDERYNFVVILTKGTKALAKQTYERLCEEFYEFIERDKVKIYDIMHMPGELSPYIRKQKLIFVVKKETRNLDRLAKLFGQYEDFKEKRVLFIDDEADYASIGFKVDKKQEDEISINTLATKINMLRGYGAKTDFLQVTATPYSLYLQPETMQVNGENCHPMRPAFTQLVPIHEKYIGSEFYFEESDTPNSPASYLHVDVPEKEFQVLGRRDERYLSSILNTPNLEVFRFAVLNFLVGGSIRRLQEQPENYKCSCIIHTQTSREKHTWQYMLVKKFLEKLETTAQKKNDVFKKMVCDSYNNLKLSIEAEQLPEFNKVFEYVKEAVIDGYVGIHKINSESEIAPLLDRKGQLRLDNPFNIFIGGQILDRGITIENLICFFYGRNPKKFQQDTVLQHCRMYGARSKKDISVTRFYTSARIYGDMKKMHQMDAGLREAFMKGQHNDGVVFLEKDSSGKINICAPNKILISSTETIRPYRRFFPYGMQTVSATEMTPIAKQIDSILAKYDLSKDDTISMEAEEAIKILELIHKSYMFSDHFDNVNYRWDVSLHKSIIRRLCKSSSKIYCIVRRDRNTSRYKASYTFSNAPDDGQKDRPLAKKYAEDSPVLLLLHQNGKKDNGWRDVPFWWPVLVCPKNTNTLVFATKTK